MNDNQDILQALLSEPWALATSIIALAGAFLGWLFREVIKEALIGKLKARRDRASRVAEIEKLFNAGEVEMLSALEKTGGYLIVSTRERIEGHTSPIRLVDLSREWRMPIANFDDLLALHRRGFLDGTGGHATRLTDRGKEAGNEMLRIFGVPDVLTRPKSKEL